MADIEFWGVGNEKFRLFS